MAYILEGISVRILCYGGLVSSGLEAHVTNKGD